MTLCPMITYSVDGVDIGACCEKLANSGRVAGDGRVVERGVEKSRIDGIWVGAMSEEHSERQHSLHFICRPHQSCNSNDQKCEQSSRHLTRHRRRVEGIG